MASAVEAPPPLWKLAREGVDLVINNRSDEAEALFKQHPDSLQMFAGHCYATFMDSLMTFEDDKLNVATAQLKELESRCLADTGWLRSVKTKVFGAGPATSLADSLESQIILADSQLCLALLTFLQQDLSGYFKGGWILRKSWKLYQQAYNEIRNLYKDIVGEFPEATNHIPQRESCNSVEESGAVSDSSCEWEFPDEPTAGISSPSHNGYIHKASSPKMPHSYTTGFEEKLKTNLSTNNNCDTSCFQNPSRKSSSDNESGFFNAKSDQSAASKTSKEGRGSPSSLNRVNLFLKKSTSANSALSKHLHKNGIFSPFNSNLSLSYFTSTFSIFSSDKKKGHDIDQQTVTRLMGAVSFGYGLFHLGISLLPPSLLKITNFFGFRGNRHIAVSNLMYARLGQDMRAPLATLSLLWYHTIVRPFYALDGSNVQAGVNVADQLIAEAEEEYKNSALFLFFKGRVHRLNSDIPAALEAFQASVTNSNQREMKVLSLHEIGWCNLILLNYPAAEHTFQILKLSSRWSKAFYAYLAMICSGSCGNLKDYSTVAELRGLVENGLKGSQLELFLTRRYKCFPDNEQDLLNTSEKFWKLLMYELQYLWNTLPSCSPKNIAQIIADCELTTADEEPMVGLAKLIQGSCYCILHQYENGMAEFRRCLELRRDLPSHAEDAHVSAFAQYELGTLMIRNPQHNPYDQNKELLEWSATSERARHEFYMLLYAHKDVSERASKTILEILKR